MTLDILRSFGNDDLARVFVARTADGALIEFVESVQPPIPREQKWVLIVSTLKGCPVKCPICDAGGAYGGKLSAPEIFAQVAHMVKRRFPDGRVPIPQLKIQFARMGDPSFNDAVLDCLDELKGRLDAPGLMPSISTVAPKGCVPFVERLARIRTDHYGGGRFQMQFSIHTTCDTRRRELIPIRTLPLADIARTGAAFFAPGDRKVTLNFAAVKGYPLDPSVIADHFDPALFIVKLTPVNPTAAAAAAGLQGLVDPADLTAARDLQAAFLQRGFDVILSIGELEENQIGSNCGMYVAKERMRAAC